MTLESEPFCSLKLSHWCNLNFITHAHPTGFYRGYQCSWTLISVESTQVSILEFFKHNQAQGVLTNWHRSVDKMVFHLIYLMKYTRACT